MTDIPWLIAGALAGLLLSGALVSCARDIPVSEQIQRQRAALLCEKALKEACAHSMNCTTYLRVNNDILVCRK